MDTILVVNAGSSSVKFQVYAVGSAGSLKRQLKGQVDGIGSRPRLRATGADGVVLMDRVYQTDVISDGTTALAVGGDWLRDELQIQPLAIGHRVVHGVLPSQTDVANYLARRHPRPWRGTAWRSGRRIPSSAPDCRRSRRSGSSAARRLTSDTKHGAEVARKISTGMVFVNHPTMVKADLPFGGVRRSGYGRELLGLGIKEFVNHKLIDVVDIDAPF
jgi:hypothetical protein